MNQFCSLMYALMDGVEALDDDEDDEYVTE
jgi:hypothetical protein